MRLLVVGSGAREHALCRRLLADPGVDAVICAPGNAGIATVAATTSVDQSAPDDLLALAARERVDLTIVGPEVPLSAGIADRFADAARLLFGPTQAAARLESSKTFA